MKTLKITTALKQIKEGKIEMMQDLKIGYVEIRNTTSGARQIIEVIN
jgi:hypothetical protein